LTFPQFPLLSQANFPRCGEKSTSQADSTATSGLLDLSLVFDNALLRDSDGHLLQADLNPEEIAALEWLAERGQVHRFLKKRKRRTIAIFRLLPTPEPPPDPSSSKVTDCSLTDIDMRQLAAGDFTRRRFERWTGWGLLAARERKP